MRFRTRSQEIEAIQWKGDNLEEVQAFCTNHGFGPVAIDQYDSTEVVITDWDEPVSKWRWVFAKADGTLGVDNDKCFRNTFEPTPGLISTVEDYEGLPDLSIIQVVEIPDHDYLSKGCCLTVDTGMAYLTMGVEFELDALALIGAVCSIVRLGGDQT